jgi:muconate cycloisomerase
MKIASIEVIPVRLPFREPISDSWGTYHASNHGIVIVRDESGLYGAGEIALAWFGGAHGLCREVNEFWIEKLVGLEVCGLSRIDALLEHLCSFSKRHLLAKAGVETALWDLYGKSLGVPVYNLLGGKLRDSIPLTGGVSMGSLDHMVEVAARRVSEGYRELKLKVGLDDKLDLEAVRCIRQTIPDSVGLRVDANMAWRDVKRAKRVIDEMTHYGVHIVEQPIPSDNLDDLRWLREQTEAIILIDDGLWDVQDAKRHLDAGAADMLHVYVSEAGGLQGAKRIFELAALHGQDCTIGSMPEGRIGAAASAHLAAAMPNLSGYASDIRGFTSYGSDVASEELVISEGELLIPNGTGFGITIDFEKLKHLSVHG